VVQAGMIIVLAAVYPVMMIAMMLVCSWHLGVGSYPAPLSLGGVEGNRGPAALQRAIWQFGCLDWCHTNFKHLHNDQNISEVNSADYNFSAKGR
jgi:hypothetical protein